MAIRMKTHNIVENKDYSLSVETKKISADQHLVRFVRNINGTIIRTEHFLTPSELRLLIIAIHPDNSDSDEKRNHCY